MIQINLLPVREERRRADLRQFALMLGASVIGTVAVLGAFHLKVRSDLASAQKSLKQTQVQIDSHKADIAKVEAYRATKERIETKLGVIERLERQRSGPVRVMDELAVHAPERLWLTGISSNESSMTIEGMSLDNELVAVFLTSLERSPYFGNVELEETTAAEVDGLKLNRFKLNAALLDVEPSTTAANATATPVAAR